MMENLSTLLLILGLGALILSGLEFADGYAGKGGWDDDDDNGPFCCP